MKRFTLFSLVTLLLPIALLAMASEEEQKTSVASQIQADAHMACMMQRDASLQPQDAAAAQQKNKKKRYRGALDQPASGEVSKKSKSDQPDADLSNGLLIDKDVVVHYFPEKIVLVKKPGHTEIGCAYLNDYWLEGLYVEERYRGKGYGTLLFNKAAERCARYGYRKMKWMAEAPDQNDQGRLESFYQRLGGKTDGERDVSDPWAFMYLDLP